MKESKWEYSNANLPVSPARTPTTCTLTPHESCALLPEFAVDRRLAYHSDSIYSNSDPQLGLTFCGNPPPFEANDGRRRIALMTTNPVSFDVASAAVADTLDGHPPLRVHTPSSETPKEQTEIGFLM